MIDEIKRKAEDALVDRLKGLAIFRKLRWHLGDFNRLPIIRKLYPDWRDRDEEYHRHGEKLNVR